MRVRSEGVGSDFGSDILGRDADRWARFEEKVRKSPSYSEMSDEIEEFLCDFATQFGWVRNDH